MINYNGGDMLYMYSLSTSMHYMCGEHTIKLTKTVYYLKFIAFYVYFAYNYVNLC